MKAIGDILDDIHLPAYFCTLFTSQPPQGYSHTPRDV